MSSIKYFNVSFYMKQCKLYAINLCFFNKLDQILFYKKKSKIINKLYQRM